MQALFYVSDDNNHYGPGVHKCQLSYPKTPRPGEWAVVAFCDALPDCTAGFQNRVVIDATGPEPVARAKNDEELKQDLIPVKLKEVKEAHELEKTRGYVTPFGYTVDCDLKDMVNWHSARVLMDVAGLPAIPIRDFHNIARIITREEFDVFTIGMGSHYQAMYDHKWSLQEYINDPARTLEEVRAVEWDYVQPMIPWEPAPSGSEPPSGAE
jgi:hypothetical protein